MRPLFRAQYYGYPNYHYARHPGYGFFWGLPFLFDWRPDVEIYTQENNYIENRIYVNYDIEPSSQMRLDMREVQRLNDELSEELDKSVVNKRRVLELYSEIRAISQEIAIESFYDYLDIVDTLPINESYYDSAIEITDDLSSQMKFNALKAQQMNDALQYELNRRPVDKVKALELFTEIRTIAQEIADERFFNYLDSRDVY